MAKKKIKNIWVWWVLASIGYLLLLFIFGAFMCSLNYYPEKYCSKIGLIPTTPGEIVIAFLYWYNIVGFIKKRKKEK